MVTKSKINIKNKGKKQSKLTRVQNSIILTKKRLGQLIGGKNKKRGGVRGRTAKRKAENRKSSEKKSRISSLPTSIVPALSKQLSYGSAKNLRSTSKNGRRIVKWQDEYGSNRRVIFAENPDGWHIESTETGCIGCDNEDEVDMNHCRACKEETRSRY